MTLMSPEAVVQRQLDAFNARDIDALMATYADDIELFEHPAKLLAAGAAQCGKDKLSDSPSRTCMRN